jgi:hypothetical protein
VGAYTGDPCGRNTKAPVVSRGLILVLDAACETLPEYSGSWDVKIYEDALRVAGGKMGRGILSHR